MTTVNGPAGIDLEPIKARAEAAAKGPHGPNFLWTMRKSQEDVDLLVEEVEALRYAVADAEARGYRRAVEALWDSKRYDEWYSAEVPASTEDITFVRSVFRRQIARYLEAAQRSITTTDEKRNDG